MQRLPRVSRICGVAPLRCTYTAKRSGEKAALPISPLFRNVFLFDISNIKYFSLISESAKAPVKMNNNNDHNKPPTLNQLNEAFHVYRRIMRIHRRSLSRISARRLADAFLKNEFRLHMAAAAESIRSSQPQQQQQQPLVTPFIHHTDPLYVSAPVSRKEQQQQQQQVEFGSAIGSPPPPRRSLKRGPLGCSYFHFDQFLHAWSEYLLRAEGEGPRFSQGRTLKPSQRMLLNKEQLQQLKKMKSMTSSSLKV